MKKKQSSVALRQQNDNSTSKRHHFKRGCVYIKHPHTKNILFLVREQRLFRFHPDAAHLALVVSGIYRMDRACLIQLLMSHKILVFRK